MAKIQRKTQKIFSGQADNNMIAAFGTMKTGNPVYSTDIEELQTEAYTQGWSEAVLEDKAPYLEEMNGMQYGLSSQIAYNFQEGVAEYDAETTYYKGSIVKNTNSGVPILYYSLTDENTGNPLTDGANWEEYYTGQSSMPIGTIFQAIRTDIPANSLRLDGTEFTTGFEGFVENYLKTGKIVSKSLSEWQTEYTMTNGNVGFFGYDEATGAFKTPCIQAGTFLAQAVASGQFGSFLNSELKSHTHSWSGTTSSAGAHTHTRGTMNITGTIQDIPANVAATTTNGAFTMTKVSDHGDMSGTTHATFDVSLNAASSWTGATSSDGAHTHTVSGTTGGTGGSDTYPKHLRYPFFVVVSNVEAESPAQTDWDNFVGNLDSKANKSLSNIDELGQSKFDAKVNKSGDTMTGNLIIDTSSTTPVIAVKKEKPIEEIPSSTYNYGFLAAYDGNNTLLGGVAVMQNSTGNVEVMLRSTYGSTKRISIYSDGTTGCPTPAAGDNSTKIATTAYCVNMRCTTKATTTSSASITRPAWVVQNYVNGLSWYRVWSDGWIEQGGGNNTTSDDPFTITFPKAFSNTNYTFTGMLLTTNTTSANGYLIGYSKTAKSCAITIGSINSSNGYSWYACGY